MSTVSLEDAKILKNLLGGIVFFIREVVYLIKRNMTGIILIVSVAVLDVILLRNLLLTLTLS